MSEVFRCRSCLYCDPPGLCHEVFPSVIPEKTFGTQQNRKQLTFLAVRIAHVSLLMNLCILTALRLCCSSSGIFKLYLAARMFFFYHNGKNRRSVNRLVLSLSSLVNIFGITANDLTNVRPSLMPTANIILRERVLSDISYKERYVGPQRIWFCSHFGHT